MKSFIESSIENEIGCRDWKTQTIWDTQVSRVISWIERGTYKFEEIDYDISNLDMSARHIVCENMYDFLVHYKLVERCELKYPIIVWHDWRILDWRHRICKAIMNGKKKIRAYRFLEPIWIDFE